MGLELIPFKRMVAGMFEDYDEKFSGYLASSQFRLDRDRKKRMNVKQVIVIRKDLKMRRGKEIAQGSHASIAFLTRKIQSYAKNKGVDEVSDFMKKMSDAELEWINGIFTKVCVTVNSEAELLEVEKKAKEAGLECHLITDRGLTEFNGVPTHTCLAIGPDEAEKIDLITGELKLY